MAPERAGTISASRSSASDQRYSRAAARAAFISGRFRTGVLLICS
ncbi:hypothetical protein [Streptomyces capoamus]